MNLRRSLSSSVLILGAVLLSIGLQASAAFTPPSTSPPNANADVPLNAGAAAQSKAGGLLLNTGGAASGLIVQLGNVGIGTASPAQPLSVNGAGVTAIASPSGGYQFGVLNGGASNLTIGSDATNVYIQSWASKPLQINNQGNSIVLGVVGSSVSVPGNLTVTGTCTGCGGAGQWTTSGSNIYYNVAGGNVGVGTTDPQARLAIGNSTTGAQRLLYVAEPGFVAGSGATAYGLSLYGSSVDGVFKFFGMNAGVETTNPILAMNRSSGNVGIGTASPGVKLEVASGDIYIHSPTTDYLFIGSGPTLQGQVGWDAVNNKMLVQTSGYTSPILFNNGSLTILGGNGSGNVGIGTVAPQYKLQVTQPAADWTIHANGTGGYGLLGTGSTYAGYFQGPIYGTGNLSVAGSITAGGTIHTSGDILADGNYGLGLVGVYSSVRYQNVFAMGAAYRLAADGTTPGNLYGIAWTHENVGGQSKPGLQHQALFMLNGVTQTAIGSGIWTNGNVTIGGAISAAGTVSGGGFYTGDWFRPTGGTGVYWNAYGSALFSDTPAYVKVASTNGMPFYLTDRGTITGYVYHDASGFGLLNNLGQWAVTIPPNTVNVILGYYSGGNVGIGTPSPAYKLHVVGDSYFNGAVTASGGANYGVSGTGATYGVFANATGGSGVGVSATGVYSGVNGNAASYGVRGIASAVGNTSYGVYGQSLDTTGAGLSAGVYGVGSGIGSVGVQGSGYYGMYSQGTYGIYGYGSSVGGYFVGASFGVTTNSCSGCSVLAEMAPVSETPQNGDVMCTNPENGKTEICKEDKSRYLKGIAQQKAEQVLRMGCAKTLDSKNGTNSMNIGVMDTEAWKKAPECKGWYPIALSGLSEDTNVVCKAPSGKTLGYGDILVTSKVPGKLRPLDKDENVLSYQVAGKADTVCAPGKETDSIKVWIQ